MLNKTKGFLFKELFHVWEENGFFPVILVWSMGVERVGVSSHCTRPSTGRTSCGVMGRVSHAPFLFCRAVKAGEPDKIKVWFPKQQTDLSNVCQVFTSFTVKSTPAKNCPPPLQGSRMQGDEGLGFQYPLQGHTPSDAKQRLLTLELFAHPLSSKTISILLCPRFWILKRYQIKFYLLNFLSLDLQKPQHLVTFR